MKNSALMKGLKSIRQQAQQISDEFMKMGATLTKIGVAMAIPIGLATKRFADFDDQMRTVKAVSQSSEAEFQQLTETAKRLGSTTSFTAVEVAQMMTELGRAGFTAEQIDVMTAAVLNLSRASGTEGAEAAGIMAATLRQFQLDASQAARVSDVLTAAANKTFNSVSSLGEALSYAGPVAADFGMSIEDTLALLGALGNVGIQGSEGGTAVRRLLALSAAEAKEWGEGFGVTMVDAAGNVRPLIDILDEIRIATANMGTAERGAKFKEHFGILGIVAGSALGKSAVDVRALHKELLKAGGVAADTAKQMDGGLGGSLRILLSAVEGVAISIGEALAPVLIKIGDYLIPALTVIKKFIDQNKGVVQVVTGVVAGIIALGGALLAVGATFGAISFAIGGFTSVMTLVTGSISMLMTALGLLLTPVGIIAALAAVLAGLALYWLVFTDEGQRAARAVIEAFRPVLDFFKTISHAMTDALMAGEFELAGRIAMTGLHIAVIEGVNAIVGEIWRIPKALADMANTLPPWAQAALGIRPFVVAAATLGAAGQLIQNTAPLHQQLEDLRLIAAWDRELSERGGSRGSSGGGAPTPGTGGGYGPGGPVADAIAASMKSLGSFDTNALVLQNWGGIAPKKQDPQKDLLKKLDEIYKANVGIVPAVNETTAAVKRGYVEYAT